MIGPRPVTQARLRHLLSTSEQRGHSLSNSMKSLEQKELIVVSAQQLEIQQQLLLHFLHLKLESMIALPAPNSNTHTPILALMEHPRPVCLYPAPHIGSEDEHLHETRDIMLITQALVADCVSDSVLPNLTACAHHMRDDKVHHTIQPPWNALIESDKILLPLVSTNGTNATLLDEGLDAIHLQNLCHVLEHSIVSCQTRPPSEPRVAKCPIS